MFKTFLRIAALAISISTVFAMATPRPLNDGPTPGCFPCTGGNSGN
jgi:hypothetical protein